MRASLSFQRILIWASVGVCGLFFATVPLEAATGDVISVFSPPEEAPWGMAWDGANLWIVDKATDRIYEVTTTGTVLSSFAAPASDPKGLTWDGTNLWLSDDVTDLIYEINTAGTVLSSFPSVGGEPQGLTWDGVNLWVVQRNLGSVYEMTTARGRGRHLFRDDLAGPQ